MRVFPAWETRAFGFMLPNPFFPAVLLPGITFTLLYLWPFIEARVTGDYLPHELLDRPRDRPARTALGVTTLAFYTVLFFAGSNDIVAKWFEIDVNKVTWFFRIALFVIPAVSGWVTYRLMKALRASEAARFSEMPLEALR